MFRPLRKIWFQVTLIKIVTLSTFDGQPYYGNSELIIVVMAKAHTKKMCDGMRAKGISVLSYFITEYSLGDDDYDVKGF